MYIQTQFVKQTFQIMDTHKKDVFSLFIPQKWFISQKLNYVQKYVNPFS